MKVVIPKDWSEVTLSQYIQLGEVPKMDADEMDKSLRVLQILTGIEDDKFMDCSLNDLKKYIKESSFVYSIPKYPMPIKIKIGKKRFRVNYMTNTLTAGEYIDLTQYFKDSEKVNENLHLIISIYLKPINIFGLNKRGCYTKNEKGKYFQTLESRNDTAELIKGLTMDKIFPMAAFFLKNWESLIKATQDYLIQKKVKAMKNLKKELKKAGLPNIGGGL